MTTGADCSGVADVDYETNYFGSKFDTAIGDDCAFESVRILYRITAHKLKKK